VTFTDLLALLVPAGIDGYLKLVSEGAARQAEYWFRRQQGAWVWLRNYGWHEHPETLDLFVAAHDADLFFSPLAWNSVLGLPGLMAVGWVSLGVGTLGPSASSLTVPRVDMADSERVRQRLAAFTPPPSLMLHEGTRLTGLWLLAERLGDLRQLERVNRALAGRLGAQYEPPGEALLAVPGTRNTRLHPAPTVEIVDWHPERRYAAGEFGVNPDRLRP